MAVGVAVLGAAVLVGAWNAGAALAPADWLECYLFLKSLLGQACGGGEIFVQLQIIRVVVVCARTGRRRDVTVMID